MKSYYSCRRLLVLQLCIFILSLNLWSAYAQDFFIVTLDATGDVGLYSSLVLDPNNNPYISYYDATNGDLKYATKSNGIWDTETIDDLFNTGLYTSIALDVINHPYISYYDRDNEQLKLAYIESYSYWEKKWGPPAHLALCKSTSIVLHPSSENPIAAYFDNADRRLKLAIFENANGYLPQDEMTDPYDQGWATEDVTYAQYSMEDISLALDNASEPHIGYMDESAGLMYIEKNCIAAGCITQVTVNQPTGEGQWYPPETVDPSGGLGQSVSLALDFNNNNPHISYYDWALKYAIKNGGSWNTEIVDAGNGDNVGHYSSIALDSEDNPHISYYDETNGALKYAVKDGGAWSIQIIDNAANVGLYTSIALDSDDNPHISYYDATNGDLKYAVPRLFDFTDNGDGTITDNMTGLMWLKDGSYMETIGGGDNGVMTWSEAVDWADQLVFIGYDDWRLPITIEDDPSCEPDISNMVGAFVNCRESEMGHLYYVQGVSSTTPGPFINVPQQGMYNWSGTAWSLLPDQRAWVFEFHQGQMGQGNTTPNIKLNAWPVRDPLPSDTPTGANIVVTPYPRISITFAKVSKGGATTVEVSSQDPLDGSYQIEFMGKYYKIESTATYRAPITICFRYPFGTNPSDLEAKYWDGRKWVVLENLVVNRKTRQICGTISSLIKLS